jgi:tRNA dimethylallyltransferase
MNKVIAIVGPTAIGKSNLALELALKFNGEIINADSRQVYRYMDIGTAKPSKEDREKVPHYVLDIIFPNDPFSLSLYQDLSLNKINEISDRKRIPFLVGGSGLYVWSVVENWKIPEVPPDVNLRSQFEERAKSEGFGKLYHELQQLDPEASLKIMPTNVRRVIRALEIYYKSGEKASSFRKKEPANFSILIIGLTTERDYLYNQIDKRVDRMIEQGLIKEVESLLIRGYRPDLPSMSSIGYKQIGLYLSDKLTLESAISQIKTDTHRFARKQYAWFHLNDKRIEWFDVKANIKDNIDKIITSFIKEK